MIVTDLKIKFDAIIAALLKTMTHATQQDLLQVYKCELTELVRPDNGAHFNASSVSTEQLESFRVDDTAAGMAWIAPCLWDLLDTLLLTLALLTIDVTHSVIWLYNKYIFFY